MTVMRTEDQKEKNKLINSHDIVNSKTNLRYLFSAKNDFSHITDDSLGQMVAK